MALLGSGRAYSPLYERSARASRVRSTVWRLI
jgi:hypothetical protein